MRGDPKNALVINVVLAMFNLFPLRRWMADTSWLVYSPRAGNAGRETEPYGMVIPIGLFIMLPLLGAQLGLGLNAA